MREHKSKGDLNCGPNRVGDRRRTRQCVRCLASFDMINEPLLRVTPNYENHQL